MGEIIFSVGELAKEMESLRDVAATLQQTSELFLRWQWDEKAHTLGVQAYQVHRVAEWIGNIKVKMPYDDDRKADDQS